MALIYHPNIKLLYISSIARALQRHLEGSGSISDATVGVTLYSGEAPLPDDVMTSWPSYNASSPNYLVYFNDSVWAQPGVNSIIATPDPLLQLITQPTSRTPTNSGVATWAIMWACPTTMNTPPTLASMSASTLPSAGFMIVSVSDVYGSGVIRLSSTTLDTSTDVTIYQGSIASSS